LSGEAWPDTPARLDADELATFAELWAAGRIFAHIHLEGFEALRPPGGRQDPRPVRAYADEFRRAWPLWAIYMEAHGPPPESFTEKIGLFWDRLDNQTHGGFGDLPRVMHVDDWTRVLATLETETE